MADTGTRSSSTSDTAAAVGARGATGTDTTVKSGDTNPVPSTRIKKSAIAAASATQTTADEKQADDGGGGGAATDDIGTRGTTSTRNSKPRRKPKKQGGESRNDWPSTDLMEGIGRPGLAHRSCFHAGTRRQFRNVGPGCRDPTSTADGGKVWEPKGARKRWDQLTADQMCERIKQWLDAGCPPPNKTVDGSPIVGNLAPSTTEGSTAQPGHGDIQIETEAGPKPKNDGGVDADVTGGSLRACADDGDQNCQPTQDENTSAFPVPSAMAKVDHGILEVRSDGTNLYLCHNNQTILKLPPDFILECPETRHQYATKEEMQRMVEEEVKRALAARASNGGAFDGTE